MLTWLSIPIPIFDVEHFHIVDAAFRLLSKWGCGEAKVDIGTWNRPDIRQIFSDETAAGDMRDASRRRRQTLGKGLRGKSGVNWAARRQLLTTVRPRAVSFPTGVLTNRP